SRIISRAKKNPKRVVFAEADNIKILKAAQIIQDEKIAIPILMGNKRKIQRLIDSQNLELSQCIIIDPQEVDQKLAEFGRILHDKKRRKKITHQESRKSMIKRYYYACMLRETGEADALISGLTKDYPRTILRALQVVGVEAGVRRVSGMYIISTKRGPYFFT